MDTTTARRKVLYLEISCEREEIMSTNEGAKELLPPPLSQSEAAMNISLDLVLFAGCHELLSDASTSIWR